MRDLLDNTQQGRAQAETRYQDKRPTYPGHSTTEFLGITYDKMVTVSKHVQDTADLMHYRMNLLNATGEADWGRGRSSLPQVYTFTQHSVAEYESPAWAGVAVYRGGDLVHS